ncbi:MAG: YciI family protein [Rhodoluna sp.]
MPTFAVTYHYSATAEQLSEIRPIHREWLAEKLSEGILLASGPMVDVPTAILIWQVDSVQKLSQILDNDPFDIAGFIGERVIEEWNPVFGPWGQK